MKYKQKDFTIEEKNNIKNYIKKLNKSHLYAYGKKYDFNEFLSSLQKLIFYLSKESYYKNEEKIKNIISNYSQYLKLSKETENFFKNEGKEIGIDKLMHLLFIFEHLCFNELSKNIQEDFKLEIQKKTKKLIEKNLIKNYNIKLFSIKDLGAAVRRYISRYLIGITERTEMDNYRKLGVELTRDELWDNKIINIDNFEEIVLDKLKEYNLTAGQAFQFYELIGNEDKNEIKYLDENV